MNKDEWPSTLIVLGAGASAEYGFPLGTELLNGVWQAMAPGTDSRSRIVRSVAIATHRSEAVVENEATSLREALSKNTVSTIDEFLRRRAELATIGRGAIAHVLLEAETRWNVPEPGIDHFYRLMWDLIEPSLKESVTYSDGSPDVAVVTLNYDRSFENFLVDAIMVDWGRDAGEALAIVEKGMWFYHLHGDLGSLQETDFGSVATPELAVSAVANALPRLKLMDDPVSYSTVRHWLSRASRMWFLGFGYHAKILDGLLPLSAPAAEKPEIAIGGSTYKLPNRRLEALEATFAHRCHPCEQGTVEIDLIPGDCLEALGRLRESGLEY